MIEFHHTYKAYPNGYKALRDVTFKIAKGEFVYLTGPSGAGKTTMFKLISAYDRPTSGNVRIAGREISMLQPKELPFFRRHVGVIYQDFRLLKNRTVFENVALPLVVRGDSLLSIEKRVMTVLDQVSLFAKKDCLPLEMSGGEQQRVAIARALVHQPEVLIADEPTGNLDPTLSEDIISLLESANARGTTVFVATHDHDLVKRKQARRIDILQGELKSDS
ncbi:MAG: cell division ATP-binding protein FtsE [Bdellovibrionales bacterium]|nr:cell division ATP-binding protein FtsE [Bdellovibrionales bacterium]